jgi:hypothetical protein
MADVYNIDDLIKLGKLNKETLVLDGGGKIFINIDLTLPFSLKLTGNTYLGSHYGIPRTITFDSSDKPAICASAQASGITIRDLDLVSLNSPLFSVKRNKMDNVTLTACNVDTLELGDISTNSLRIMYTKFTNPQMQPLKLDSINTVSLIEASNRSQYPLLDMGDDKHLRNTITVCGGLSESASLICIGHRDDTGCTAFTYIPDHSIIVSGVGKPRHQLLSIKENDRYITLPEASTRSIFA